MNEWIFNDIPAQKNGSAIGCQKKVNAWNGYIVKNWKVSKTLSTSYLCGQCEHVLAEERRFECTHLIQNTAQVCFDQQVIEEIWNPEYQYKPLWPVWACFGWRTEVRVYTSDTEYSPGLFWPTSYRRNLKPWVPVTFVASVSMFWLKNGGSSVHIWYRIQPRSVLTNKL